MQAVGLRPPIVLLMLVMLPLAVLTQSPFAQSVRVEEPAPVSELFSATMEEGAPVSAFALPSYDRETDFSARLSPLPNSTPPLFTLSEIEPPDALFALRALPNRDAYADWLAYRLNEIIAETGAPAPSVRFVLPEPPPRPTRALDVIPMYDVWVAMLHDQPPPKRADEFITRIKRIFAEEGVPEEFAWLPEVESMFDPRARNRIGARGLFQFMPGTALEQGLRLRPYDERIHPEKSARAAAILLRRLHDEFDSWPLALAAYNAGENRVRRTLQRRDATTFAEIAHMLPSETRLYVPRVLATMAVREGYDPALLAAPRVAAID